MKKAILLSTAISAVLALYAQPAIAQTALEEAPPAPEPIDPGQTIGSQFTSDADAEIIIEEGTLVVPTPFFPGFDFGVFIDGAARAAVLEQGAQIVADTPSGFGMVSTASGGILTISGSIITSGFQGGGVFVQGPTANVVNVTETGVVFTSGNGFNSAGIQALGTGDTVNIDGRVQSQGVEAPGVLVGLAEGISVNVGATGQVLTEGDFAPGLSTFLDPRAFNISFANTGLVQTFGNAAPGMVLATEGSSAVNDGVVATVGAGSPGVLLVQGNVSLINNGTISASGGTFGANIEELVGLASPGGGTTQTTVQSAGVFVANGGITVTNSGSITSANGPGIFTSADFAAVTNGSGFGTGDVSMPVIITNTASGTIAGGTVAIQGSALIERVTNSGSIVGDVLLDLGDDSFTLDLSTGSVDGVIDGGDGVDMFTLSGNGAFNGTGQTGFETLSLVGGGEQVLSGDFGAFEMITASDGISVVLADGLMLRSSNGAMFEAGTILAGTGTIDADLTSGGIVDPGGAGASAPGVLTVLGDFELLQGGLLAFGLTGSAVDMLVVGGSARIDGDVTILADTAMNFGMLGDTLTLIRTESGLSVANLSPQTFFSGVMTLVATPVVDGNDLLLRLSVSSDFSSISGLDTNGLAIAGALDSGFAGSPAGSDFRAAAGNLDIAAGTLLTDSLSAEFYDVVTRASVLSADRAMEQAFARTDALRVTRKPGLWAAVGYEGFDRDGTEAFGYEIDQFNAAFGADLDLGAIIAGLAVTYTSSDLEVATSPLNDAGKLETIGILAYASTGRSSGFNVDAALTYQSADAETTRSTSLSGVDGLFLADAGSDIFSAEIRGSYLQPIGDRVALKGWLGLDYVSVGSDSFDETGAGSFALSVDAQSYEEFGGSAGFNLIGNFGSQSAPVRPYVGGSIRRAFNDEGPIFGGSFLNAGSNSFVVEGDFDRTEYGVNAGIGATIANGGATINAGYRGGFSDNNDTHQAVIQLVVPL